jgi:hypothetical protein
MIGQPELRDTLALPQLRQLRQRITVSYHLQPLDTDETAAYVNHRLRRAALGPAVELPRDVTDLIHRRSRGVPRIINVIADATLLFAYGVDRRDVDVGITQDALAELDATGVLASYHSEGADAAAAAAMSMAQTQDMLRLAEDVRTREQALAVKERQLAQREQQIAVQQRLVEEEARILAAARTRSANAAPTHAAAARTDAVGADAQIAGADTQAVAAGADTRGVGAGTVNVSASTPRPTIGTVASTSSTAAPAGNPARPAMRSGAAPTSKVFATRDLGLSPSGVRVQRYAHTLSAQEHSGFWERLRRMLFGVTESERGA